MNFRKSVVIGHPLCKTIYQGKKMRRILSLFNMVSQRGVELLLLHADCERVVLTKKKKKEIVRKD